MRLQSDYEKFQFLGRNSGRSDATVQPPRHPPARVSIPRSEFWSFGLTAPYTSTSWETMFQFLGRNSGRSDAVGGRLGGGSAHVSIPRSEFWSFGQPSEQATRCTFWLFQFLGRNSGRSDEPESWRLPVGTDGFNSSVGILVVRTTLIDCRALGGQSVSIPRSEFWSFGPLYPDR